MIKEFKKFISRGNVMDLAVGVIVGGAFSSIVTSLVNDILMPIIGVIIGGINFEHIQITIGSSVIKLGSFLQNIVDFVIIAFCVFLIVKFINKLNDQFTKKEEKKEEAKKETVSEEILLLRQINESLKKQTKTEKKSKTK